jgi:hypothetical protein
VFEEKQVDRIVGYFLRFLKRLTKDEEFNHVLSHHRASGTRDDYVKRLEEALAEISKKDVKQQPEFNKVEFSRKFLKEFLQKDPYIPQEED